MGASLRAIDSDTDVLVPSADLPGVNRDIAVQGSQSRRHEAAPAGATLDGRPAHPVFRRQELPAEIRFTPLMLLAWEDLQRLVEDGAAPSLTRRGRAKTRLDPAAGRWAASSGQSSSWSPSLLDHNCW